MTSLLAKYFFSLKNITKCAKFVRILESFVTKYTFDSLKYETNRDKEN